MGSFDLMSCRALILSNMSAETGSVLIRCCAEGICCDAAFRMIVRKITLLFWQFVGTVTAPPLVGCVVWSPYGLSLPST